MNICIVQAHRLTREVVVRALASRLNAEVIDFCCVEDLLGSSMDYDVFVVYGNLGRRMPGAKGVAQIRKQKPDALIIGVSDMPDAQAKFLASGADAFLLKAGNEIAELIGLIRGYESKELPAASPGGGTGRSV